MTESSHSRRNWYKSFDEIKKSLDEIFHGKKSFRFVFNPSVIAWMQFFCNIRVFGFYYGIAIGFIQSNYTISTAKRLPSFEPGPQYIILSRWSWIRSLLIKLLTSPSRICSLRFDKILIDFQNLCTTTMLWHPTT